MRKGIRPVKLEWWVLVWLSVCRRASKNLGLKKVFRFFEWRPNMKVLPKSTQRTFHRWWFHGHRHVSEWSVWTPYLTEDESVSLCWLRTRAVLIRAVDSDVDSWKPKELCSYGNRTFAAVGPRLWTLFQSSCVILTSPRDCSDDSWSDTFSGSMNTVLCDFWYTAP